jgi:hypothetical protein
VPTMPVVLSSMGVARSEDAAPSPLLESPAKVPTNFGRVGVSPSWSPFWQRGEIGIFNEGERFVGSAPLCEGLAELFFDELSGMQSPPLEAAAPPPPPPQQEPAASPLKVFYF